MAKKKIIGYCRVSTLEQKKKGYGIDIQVREIEKFAKDNKLRIDRIFKDKAVSGTKESRKELDALLDLCQKGEVKAVIAPSTDRMSRTVRISENLYYELSKHDIRLYFADMPFYDPDNHQDVMIRQIKQVMAESSRNEIIKRLQKGREERIRKGHPPGGKVPYGYYRKNKKWLISPAEKEIVRLIYKLNDKKEKPSKITQILNEKGFKRRNGTEWVRRQIPEILERRDLYEKGIIHYGGGKGENKKLIILGDD